MAQQGLPHPGITRIGAAEPFHRQHLLGPGHVLGILAAEGELGELDGVGAVGGGFAGGNELVGGGDGVIDGRAHREQQVLRQGHLLRPVGDIGAEHQLLAGVGPPHAEVDPGLVGGVVVGEGLLGRIGRGCGQLVGPGEHAAVEGGGGDAPGVHEGHVGHLPVGGLAPLPVGEITGGVTDGESPVGGHVARAEAGAAEAGADGGAGGHKGGNVAPPGQLQVDGLAGGIDRQPELAGADGAAVQDLGRPHDILVGTAGAAGDDSLIHPEFAVHNLLPQ